MFNLSLSPYLQCNLSRLFEAAINRFKKLKNQTQWIDSIIERLNKLIGVAAHEQCIAHVIPMDEVIRVLTTVSGVFMNESCLAECEAPCKVVGDIHGQFQDLNKLFDVIGRVPQEKLVFLGDYVDRGPQSIEVVVYLMALKIRHPDRIFLLRGNHETPAVNKIYGFYNECAMKYGYPGIGLWWDFQSCFNRIPMAGLISKKILCMHGGLSPDLTHLDIIRKIVRPCEPLDRGLLIDLLWSDPTNKGDGWFHSIRGISYMFGKSVLEQACQVLGIDMVIRAHQVVQDGYEIMAGRRLITVFSAPNYCNQFSNTAAVVCLDADLKVTLQQLWMPLPSNSRAKPAPAVACDPNPVQAQADKESIKTTKTDLIPQTKEAEKTGSKETEKKEEAPATTTTEAPAATPETGTVGSGGA